MWLTCRVCTLSVRASAALTLTRRCAHTLPTTPAAPQSSRATFDVKKLPPQLQREFCASENERALQHLVRRQPTTDVVVITSSTVHPVVWQCTACDTQWSARPSDRTNPQRSDQYRCPSCHPAHTPPSPKLSASPSPTAPPSRAANLLCEAHPALAAQWDAARNDLPQNHVLQSVTDVHTSSSTKVWWRCSLCCTPWLESVSSRVTRYELALQDPGAGVGALLCPACERRGASLSAYREAAQKGVSLNVTREKPRRCLSDDRLLLAEALLRPSQNPAEISLTSEAMLQWRCRSCQFEYGATVANRFLRHERCPQCSGKEKSMMNLLVIQRPDVVAEVSKHVSRTKLRHMTVHDDAELSFVCRTCFSPYRMTARARCAVPRGVPACSKCFLTSTQVLAEAQQQMQRRGAQHLSSRARQRVKQKALQLNRSSRNADHLAAAANELRNRDGALKD